MEENKTETVLSKDLDAAADATFTIMEEMRQALDLLRMHLLHHEGRPVSKSTLVGQTRAFLLRHGVSL